MVLAQHILSLTVLEESGWMVPKKQIPSCFLSSMENIKVKERCDCSDAACLMLCRWMLLMWVHCNETTTSWGPDEILRAHLCAVTGFISLLLAAQPCRACFWACLHAGCINTKIIQIYLMSKTAHKGKSDVSHILVNCTSCPLISCCRDPAQPQEGLQPRWAWMPVNPKPTDTFTQLNLNKLRLN